MVSWLKRKTRQCKPEDISPIPALTMLCTGWNTLQMRTASIQWVNIFLHPHRSQKLF
nr:unnamed protein product [Callosobruchus analis]